ncbi:MAG TPA: hypothetical protein VFM88_02095 [Vicinamibacteria bacterium]|nr:hypothetical protein [Vicinamibacteria bacterium]
MRGPERRGLWIGLAGAAWLLLATAAATRELDLAQLGAYRRLWSDLAVGIDTYLDARHPLPEAEPPRYSTADGLDADQACRRWVVLRVRAEGIRPWQFWRTLPARGFLRERLEPVPKPYDDHGRGRLLGLAFQATGGIAPFLIAWLGALCCAPVLAWTAWELSRAGYAIAGAVFVALLGLSSYFVEALALTRYPVGFYLIGVALAVPLATYAALRPNPSARGLGARALLAAAAFAGAAACRSSVGLLLPAFLLAIVVGARRVLPAGRRRATLAAALAAAFLLPYPLMKRSQQNDVWQPLWEGLGDFDREKGHAWSDAAAREALRLAGGEKLWTTRSESFFRDEVLRHVRQDPLWYAAILWRRLGGALSQAKLAPWTPRDGVFLAPSTTANEGVMDKYYTYVATADFFGLGAAQVELPIAVLLIPLPALAALAVLRRRCRPALLVVGSVAVGALPLPVLITTAGGQEPQALVLAYLLSAAFLADEAFTWRATSESGPARRAASPPST